MTTSAHTTFLKTGSTVFLHLLNFPVVVLTSFLAANIAASIGATWILFLISLTLACVIVLTNIVNQLKVVQDVIDSYLLMTISQIVMEILPYFEMEIYSETIAGILFWYFFYCYYKYMDK